MPSFILSMITGPGGKILTWIIAAAVLAFAVFGYLKVRDYQVETATSAKFQKAQLEQVLQEQKDLIQKMDRLSVLTQQITEDLSKKNAEIDELAKNLSSLNEALDGKEQAPDHIKRTIEQLKKAFP